MDEYFFEKISDDAWRFFGSKHGTLRLYVSDPKALSLWGECVLQTTIVRLHVAENSRRDCMLQTVMTMRVARL